MPNLNLLVFLNAYSDGNSSNAPSRNNFKWARDINTLLANNPMAQSDQLAISEARSIFSGGAAKKLLYVEADQNCTLLIQGTASYTGTPAGASTQVILRASNPGVAGNSIALVFNGSTTIAAAIAAWNIANPTNQLTLAFGVGTQTPTAQTVTLNGLDKADLRPLVLGTFPDGTPNNTPGMFLRTDGITSLQITNQSTTDPCNVFVATVE